MKDFDAQELIKCISALHRKTQVFLNASDAEIGITGSRAVFLIITCENGRVPQNRFCELLDMSRGTVAKMLARLEQEGYVERRGNPDDARGVDVYPTDRARALYPRLLESGAACAARLTAGMSEVERMAFCELLRRACRNMGAH